MIHLIHHGDREFDTFLKSSVSFQKPLFFCRKFMSVSQQTASLTSFIGAQFPGSKVVRLDRNDSGYMAALSNGISLRTDLQGKLA